MFAPTREEYQVQVERQLEEYTQKVAEVEGWLAEAQAVFDGPANRCIETHIEVQVLYRPFTSPIATDQVTPLVNQHG